MTDPVPVSVVIPTFNRARRLDAALRSVEAQTAPPREIIVVDDGSTEPVAAVTAGRARYVRQNNRGSGAARNAGVAAASQPWIAFLDSDDRWCAEKLERQSALLDARPDVDVVACDYRIDAGGRLRRKTGLQSHASLPSVRRTRIFDRAYVLEAASAAAALATSNFIPTSTVLIRKRCIEDAGGFDPAYRYCEDYELWLRLLRGTTFGFIDRPLMAYALGADALSRNELAMHSAERRIAEAVRRRPERYPPEAVAASARRLPSIDEALGRAYLRAGDARTARRHLGHALRRGLTLKRLALYAFTYGGTSVVRRRA